MSVKKSILDGRLLPGKSVLIPGLILDQRLRRNDMPLGPKMNTFGSGNWMEMCQVIAPAGCFALSALGKGLKEGEMWQRDRKRGREKERGGEREKSKRRGKVHGLPPFPHGLLGILRAIVVRLLQMPSA